MNYFNREMPKSRISITLDLHAGGVQKKAELPLKILEAGDFSAGAEHVPLTERKKVNIDKNNFELLPYHALHHPALPGRRYGHRPVAGVADAEGQELI